MSSEPTTFATLADLLVRAATAAPERVAVALPSAAVTYGDLLTRVQQTARALVARGIGRGSHVGILAPNGVAFIEALFATQMVGAVAVPINVRNKVAELRFIIQNADLDALLTTTSMDHYNDLSLLLCEAFPEIKHQDPAGDLRLAGAERLRLVALLDGEQKLGMTSRHDLVARGRDVTNADVDEMRHSVGPKDRAMILYTSGTTAHPKGCILSQDALLRGPVERSKTRFRTTNEQEVFWIPGPLFHVGALSPYICCVAAGGTVLTDGHFDAGRALRQMRTHRITSGWPWFPVITSALLDHPEFEPSLLTDLRYLGQVGPRSLFERLRDLLPAAELVKSSGMTETAGSFGLSTASETFEDRVRFQGRPVEGVEVRVVDPTTEADLPHGDIGHLLIRGYCVTSGYYRADQATKDTISADGWLRTGDFYSQSADGQLSFHGRIKEMLKVGGENVAPMEVEEFLCSHPDVQTAAVVGLPDARLDEVPVAFVELRPGADLAQQQLIDFCAGRIASFKVPRAIHFVEPGAWPTSTEPRGVVGFEVVLGALLASLDGGVITSIHRVVE